MPKVKVKSLIRVKYIHGIVNVDDIGETESAYIANEDDFPNVPVHFRNKSKQEFYDYPCWLKRKDFEIISQQ